MRPPAARAAVLPVVFFAHGSAATGAEVIRNAAVGTPKLKSIDAIRFAPDGVLLIGDGPGAQLVAVDKRGAGARGQGRRGGRADARRAPSAVTGLRRPD